MPWFRGPGRVLGGCLLVILLAPSLAPWPSSLIDRGQGGAVRVSAFPLALVAFDPFVWTCARNSFLVASATAGGSLVLGVGLGWLVGRGRFWGRSPLWVLAFIPLAAGPLLLAPAIASAIGGQRGWDWLAARSILGVSAESSVRWAVLVWIGLASGAPLVALATLSGLRRVDPSWTEAALAVGASGRRAWRDVTWPSLRPEVARASALVFALTMVEPAGPMVLGLGRTLAVQIVHSASRHDQPTRTSGLALLAIPLALVGRSILGWWGGATRSRTVRPVVEPLPMVGFRPACLSFLVLTAWSGATAVPVLAWIWRAIREALDSGHFSGRWPIGRSLADPEILAWAANSAVTAGLAVAVDLAILRLLAVRGSGRGGRAVDLACRTFEAVPPLALGAGALAIPWLLVALADSSGEPLAHWFRWLAMELSPGRSPGFLLIVVLAAGQLPMLAERSRRRHRTSRADAARLMGQSDRRADRVDEVGWFGVVPLSSVLLAFTLAATSLAPALLLTPFSERRTLGPGILKFVLEAGPLDPRAVGPIVILLGANLLAIALVSRRRDGSSND